MTQNSDLNLWHHFIQKANAALQASQPKAWHRFISLMLEPHFSNHELLQVQWQNGEARWYRSTWHKDADARRFKDPVEALQYARQNAAPVIESSSGTMHADKAETLWQLMNGFSLNALVDKDHGIVLDGCLHTLHFGIGQNTVCYEWNALPEAFKGLDLAVDLMFGICRHSG